MAIPTYCYTYRYILIFVVVTWFSTAEGVQIRAPNTDGDAEQQCTGTNLDYSRLATVRGLQGEEGLLVLAATTVGEENWSELDQWYTTTRIQELPISTRNEQQGTGCPPSRVRVEERREGVPIYGANMVLTLGTLECEDDETARQQQQNFNSSQQTTTIADILNGFQIEGMFGKKFTNINVQKGFQPSLSADQAKAIVAAHYSMSVDDITGTPTLYIYPSTTEDYLSYFLDVLVLSEETVAVYEVVLDAHSGEFINACTLVDPEAGRASSQERRRLLRSSNDAENQRQLVSCATCATPVNAASYGSATTCSINSLYLDDTGKTTTCTEATLFDGSTVNVPYTDDALFWNGVYDCQNTRDTCYTVSFPTCEDAISDLQYGSIRTLQYLQTSLKVLGGLNADAASPQSVIGFAHFGTNYCNAFYNANQVVFGDCDCSYSSPLVALDVVAHEIMHGVTAYSSGLRYSDQSGGLNEGYSDIMGCVIEYVVNDAMDTPDFLVGEALVGAISPLRDMENPPSDGSSSGDICDYYDGINVHSSSGILNKAFVKAVRACEANGCVATTADCVLLVGPLFLYANLQKLTTLSTFSDAALQTCVVVEEFLASIAAYGTCSKDTLAQFVIDGWSSVGITIDSTACGSVTTAACPAPAPAPSPTDPPCSFVCFSDMATVSVRDKGRMQMSELEVGDYIQTAAGYQPIYAFAHRDENISANYLRIYTAGGNGPLEISAEHLVYIADKKNPVRADSVSPGDALQGENHNVPVVKVEVIYRSGLFAPLTPDGTLIVDGIVSSCYVSLQRDAKEHLELQGGVPTFLSQHTIIHMTLSPMRMVCIMGIGGEICKSYHEGGLIPVVKLGLGFADFAQAQSIPVQLLLLAMHCLVFCPFFAMEGILGPKLALIALVGLVCLTLVHRRPLSGKKGIRKAKVC